MCGRGGVRLHCCGVISCSFDRFNLPTLPKFPTLIVGAAADAQAVSPGLALARPRRRERRPLSLCAQVPGTHQHGSSLLLMSPFLSFRCWHKSRVRCFVSLSFPTPILPLPAFWQIDAIVKTYPDARFVWCHRDPCDVAKSHLALFSAVASMYDDHAGSRWPYVCLDGCG